MQEPKLVWYPELGYGKAIQKGNPFQYGQSYWEEFRTKQETPVGKILTAQRKTLVLTHSKKPRSRTVDIGIGGGAFVEAMGCEGFDVNLVAQSWLVEQNKLWTGDPLSVMTFWDSIEHIDEPNELLAKCEDLAFVSTPIYESAEACVRSKHFKPPEHLLYFTEKGLTRYMAEQGFCCVEKNRMEEYVGREEIGTYVFRRVAYP
jgi:hypothetical protein